MTGLRQEFCVRWNSHLGSIGAAFPQLLAGQRFVDVTLACEGHQLHCHRLVLAACSSYFESILAENPCKHPVIILPNDVKLWEIQALIDFMYKGEVNVTQAGLPNLLRCAESLRIRGLYGSDAALNINQLKMMTHQNKIFNSSGNVVTTQSSSSTTTGATAVAPVTTTSSTTNINLINSNVTTDDDDSEMLTVPCKELNDSDIKRYQQQSTLSNGTDSAISSPAAAATATTTATSAITPQMRKQQQQQHLQHQSPGNNQLQQQQQHQNFQQQIQMQKQIEQQQLQLQQQQQQLISNQSIKNENYCNESADDSRSTFDNYEDYSGSKGDLLQDDDNFTGENDEEDSYSGENDNDNLTSSAQNSLSINHQNNNSTSSSYKRVRRADELLAQAARCVSKGQTYQTASNMFNIPVSTLRFHMARRGILPVRKRGRGAASTAAAVALTQLNSGTHNQQQQQQHQQQQQQHNNTHNNNHQQQQQEQHHHRHHQMKTSPHSPNTEPTFHMVGYQLPEQKQNLI